MNLKYSHSGDPKPNTSHHVFDPNSLLLHEIKNENYPKYDVMSQEYFYMMDFEPKLPLLDIYHDQLHTQQQSNGGVSNKVEFESE